MRRYSGDIAEILGRCWGDIGRYRTAGRARCAASPTLTLAPTSTLTLTLDPNPSPNPNGIPNLKPIPSPTLALTRCGLAPDKSTLTVPRDLGHFEALTRTRTPTLTQAQTLTVGLTLNLTLT